MYKVEKVGYMGIAFFNLHKNENAHNKRSQYSSAANNAYQGFRKLFPE
jgi:hypothetical protein